MRTIDLRMSGRDQGSGSIWVLATAAVLGAAGIVVTLVLGLVLAHRRALAAADLAALGGAARLQSAGWLACSEAAGVATANGAQLESCQVQAGAVTVVVRVDRVPPLVPEVTATARAGVPVIPFPVDG